jgi:hypothetical protein
MERLGPLAVSIVCRIESVPTYTIFLDVDAVPIQWSVVLRHSREDVHIHTPRYLGWRPFGPCMGWETPIRWAVSGIFE